MEEASKLGCKIDFAAQPPACAPKEGCGVKVVDYYSLEVRRAGGDVGVWGVAAVKMLFLFIRISVQSSSPKPEPEP